MSPARGGTHTDNEIQAWGPTARPDPIPRSLVGKKVINVACGSFHTVALTADGEVYCWGDNANGQCGLPRRPPRPLPLPSPPHLPHHPDTRPHAIHPFAAAPLRPRGEGVFGTPFPEPHPETVGSAGLYLILNRHQPTNPNRRQPTPTAPNRHGTTNPLNSLWCGPWHSLGCGPWRGLPICRCRLCRHRSDRVPPQSVG